MRVPPIPHGRGRLRLRLCDRIAARNRGRGSPHRSAGRSWPPARLPREHGHL